MFFIVDFPMFFLDFKMQKESNPISFFQNTPLPASFAVSRTPHTFSLTINPSL